MNSEPIAITNSSIFGRSSEQVAITSSTIWTKVYKSLPIISNTVYETSNHLSEIPVVFASASQSSSTFSSVSDSIFGSSDLTAVVNKALYGQVQCRLSSTEEDFLDANKNIFLPVSPAALSDISGMVNTDSEEIMGEGDKCDCSGDNSCSDCLGKVAAARKKTEGPPQLVDIMALLQTISKTVNTLTDDVNGLRENVGAQTTRIARLEASSKAGSRTSSRASSRVASCDEARTSQGPSVSQGVQKCKKANVNSKSKLSRQEEEKVRSLQVVKDQLKELKEKQSRDKDIQADGESSDGSLFNVKALKKKMSRREKKACDLKVSDRLEQAGGIFPEDESSSSNGGPSSSGMKSESG